MKSILKLSLISSFLLLSFLAKSQEKHPMTINDLETWKSIRNRIISPNGQFVAYQISPNKGDSKLYLYRAKQGDKKTFDRGNRAQLGYNNNLLSFTIKPHQDSLRAQKLRKVKKTDLYKDTLAIYLFDKDSLIKIPESKSLKIPQKNSLWLAYLHLPKDSCSAPKDSSSVAQDSIPKKKKKAKKKKKDYNLIILNTQTLQAFTFPKVSQVNCSENGLYFNFVQKDCDSCKTIQVFSFNTQNQKTQSIYKGKAKIKQLHCDKKGEQIAYTLSTDTIKEKKYQLFLYNYKTKKNDLILGIEDKQTPKNEGISNNKKLRFSYSGERLYFGTAPFPTKAEKDTLLEDEKVHLDIWSWQDTLLQPQQLIEKDKALKATTKWVYYLKSKTKFPLETSTLKVSAPLKKDPAFYLGRDDSKYKYAASWDQDHAYDYYLIQAFSNKKSLLGKNKKWRIYPAPSGTKALIWHQEKKYWSVIDYKSKKEINLSQNVKANFYNTEHDTPSLPSTYGYAGWSKDEQKVYVYSEYHIWEFDVKGKKEALCLTKKSGIDSNIEFRVQTLDYKRIYINQNKLILHTFNKETMSEGFWSLNINKREMKKLIEIQSACYPPTKAEDSDFVIWGMANFNQYPDILYNGLDFKNPKTISEANPQQKEIAWGSMHLTKWNDFNGIEHKGLLIYPAQFDSSKKYPVIVYFYEKYSDEFYRYWTPRPSHSTINFPFFASNGYFVFVPDITYKTGQPGKDAYNSIVSGAMHLSKYPFIDTKKMGLQGQSWGGYQVAYLVTQTNLFACGMAGAPVSNMTSAYGGIRWKSGLSRMFQYEQTQSRIGGTLWNSREKYIANSPVFFADKVETPLLIMHNDNDGAVPWYQGIEYFVALRRLNKPAWLLNYNGDGHNLMKWANRVDLSKRMFSFFNHYLKGEAMPKWMKYGLPATKKGKELRY